MQKRLYYEKAKSKRMEKSEVNTSTEPKSNSSKVPELNRLEKSEVKTPTEPKPSSSKVPESSSPAEVQIYVDSGLSDASDDILVGSIRGTLSLIIVY